MTRQNIQGTEWANAGSVTDPGSAKKDLGYIAEKPPFQTENYVQNRQDEMLAHIEEHGIPVWDALTIYNADSYTLGSDGKIYKSQTSPNTNHDPVGGTGTYWKEAFADLTTAQTFSTGIKTIDALKLGGNQDANNKKITLLATCTSNQDAANKAYVDGAIPVVPTSGFWHVDGSQINDGGVNPIGGVWETIATGLSESAICLFKVLSNSGGDTTVMCKSPDDGGTAAAWNTGSVDHQGPNKARVGTSEYCYVIAPCDSSGDVDFVSNPAAADLDIWLVGYVK